MPRGWRPPQTEAERLDNIAAETTKIIKIAMVEQGVEYDQDLAGMIGMNRATLAAKFKSGSWTQRDLCKVISVLKIRPESAVKMLGVKA